MSDRLTSTAAWNRARALKLHEHFQAIALALQSRRAKLTAELVRAAGLLDGMLLAYSEDGKQCQMALEASFKTLEREWYHWQRGGRKGKEVEAHQCRPEALLCDYRANCGGHKPMPRLLKAELQRRMTLTTGGRDKHGRAPITKAWDSIKLDFAARRPLPGIDYDDFPAGSEMPWSYSTACRHKAPRTLRALGNRGASAHKGVGAHVSMNYRELRKGELYTLDDVRLDIVCIDEATGEAVEVVCYIFMEVASRSIVGYVMKPAKAIKQEDVDELLAHMLQVPGYGLGVGYVTHLLFERGTVACSDAAKLVLEGVTHGRIKVHRTGMVGGIVWIGGPKDKARGNAAGKAVIESFNRKLHLLLLDLPGQRGNLYANQPQSLGDLGQAPFFGAGRAGKARVSKGTLVDEAERLSQFEIASGRRLKLKLPMLRLMQLNQCVAAAIRRHNTEDGHDYRGHGRFFQEEVANGVWQDTEIADVRSETAFPVEPEVLGEEQNQAEVATSPCVKAVGPARGELTTSGGKKTYVMSAPVLTPPQRNAQYWGLWKQIEALKPELDRFALTRRALGCVPKISEMTAEQFAQVIRVFTAIVRDATPQNS